MRHVIKKGVEKRADAAFEIISIEICPIGGGYNQVLRGERLDEIEVFDPYAPEYMLWIPGIFTIDVGGDQAAVRGFHKRQRWNGWLCPVILGEDMQRLADGWNTPADPDDEYSGAMLECRDGVWWLKDQNEGVWDECQSIDVEFAGETYKCWDVGTWGYCWVGLERNWLAEKPVEGEELSTEFLVISNQSTCVDKAWRIHQPPMFLNCWAPCTGCFGCLPREGPCDGSPGKPGWQSINTPPIMNGKVRCRGCENCKEAECS